LQRGSRAVVTSARVYAIVDILIGDKRARRVMDDDDIIVGKDIAEGF
jgi:hypothetical protein